MRRTLILTLVCLPVRGFPAPPPEAEVAPPDDVPVVMTAKPVVVDYLRVTREAYARPTSRATSKSLAADFPTSPADFNDYPPPVRLSWLPVGNAVESTLVLATASYADKVISGVTGSFCDVVNLRSGAWYEWRVFATMPDGTQRPVTNGTLRTSADVVRFLSVPGARNVRDIGGWTGLRQGLVYRGSQLNELPGQPIGLCPEGRRVLVSELGVRTEVDFRADNTAERGDFVDKGVLGVRFLSRPVPPPAKFFEPASAQAYRAALQVFADASNFPVYMHCAAGAERTGMVAFLLEGICGAPEETLAADLELTGFSCFAPRPCDAPQFQACFAGIRACRGSTFAEKIADFAERGLGLAREDIEAIRRNLSASVINIDCGRQLLVDDYLIASTNGVVRHWNCPVKEPDPVLYPADGAGAAARAKGERPANLTCATDGGLWWDPTVRKYRLWYQANWCGNVCYAESADGWRWTYPDLGKVPGTNRVFTNDVVDSWCVTPNYAADNPYRDWKLHVSKPGLITDDELYESSDGISFRFLGVAGVSNDRSTSYYDPFRTNWVFSLRDHRPVIGRCRAYFASRTFGGADCRWNWGRAILHGPRQSSGDGRVLPVEWLTVTNGVRRSLYSQNAVAYESLMLGVCEILYNTPNDNADAAHVGLPKQTGLHFCFSRDGKTYVPRDEPDIPPSGWGSGKWDTGYLSCISGICTIDGDRLRFYYSGLRGNGLVTDRDEKDWMRNGMYANGAIGLATLRRDGFAGLVADGRGEIVTKPLVFSGGHLFVNAECRFGKLAAEVLDESGRAIPGFAVSECEAFAGRDSTKVELRWKRARLASLAGQAVSFRFVYQVGTLYSFWVSPSARGESCGYVAAGGPEFTGLRDF